MNKITIGTHNGAFHADEIIATALIFTYAKSDIKITRTRDPKVLSSMDLVVDVGGEFDPEKGKFDHHQFRDDSDEYRWVSSAGLVHNHYIIGGMQCNDCECVFNGTPNNPCHCPDCGSNATFEQCGGLQHTTVEAGKLIKAVDARDTRSPSYNPNGVFEPLFNSINDCNKMDIGSKEQDARFAELVNIFVEYFNKDITYADLYYRVMTIGNDEKKSKSKEMSERILSTYKVGEKNGVPVYENIELKYIDTRQAFEDSPFVFIWFDNLSNTYKVSTNTNFSKIVSLGDSSNVEFLHPNGFIGGVYDINRMKIDLEVL